VRAVYFCRVSGGAGLWGNCRPDAGLPLALVVVGADGGVDAGEKRGLRPSDRPASPQVVLPALHAANPTLKALDVSREFCGALQAAVFSSEDERRAKEKRGAPRVRNPRCCLLPSAFRLLPPTEGSLP
jgi:hypothetical protein